MLRVNNALWLISDTHFGHQNIVQFCQRPANHEVIMLSEWIRSVPEQHQILHLGDVFMGRQGNPRRWADVVSRLPGEKFLIKGNHDQNNNYLYDRAGFQVIDEFVHNGYAFTHRPATDLVGGEDWDINVHGHIHNNGYGMDATLGYKSYANLSVEVTGFRPVQFGQIERFIQDV